MLLGYSYEKYLKISFFLDLLINDKWLCRCLFLGQSQESQNS